MRRVGSWSISGVIRLIVSVCCGTPAEFRFAGGPSPVKLTGLRRKYGRQTLVLPEAEAEPETGDDFVVETW